MGRKMNDMVTALLFADGIGDVALIREAVGLIKPIKDDAVAETAKMLLHFQVLKSIADGNCVNPQTAAAEAIKTH